jgi:hypothetical protein
MTTDVELHASLVTVGGEGGLGAPRMAASGRLAIAPAMAASHCVPDDPVRTLSVGRRRRTSKCPRSGAGICERFETVDLPLTSDTLRRVFCPKCGTALVERKGALWCAPGEMELSPKMRESLAELSESEPQMTSPKRTFNLGEEWFCPAEGTRMVTAEASFPRCPSCTRVLIGTLIHQLIELHPHRRWPLGWDSDRGGHVHRV